MEIGKLIRSANLADGILSQDDLEVWAKELTQQVGDDLMSRSDWESRNEQAMKLALQVKEVKSFPWPNASAVKFPLITMAALQYHSRAYPALVSGSDIVKAKVYGDDKDGEKAKAARRISRYMSYQVLEQDTGWEEATDKTLLIQAIAGTAFKKTYFASSLKRNVSELVLPTDLIVSYYTKDLASSPRITHREYLTSNDLRENQVRGLFLEYDTDTEGVQSSEPSHLGVSDERQGLSRPEGDSDTPIEFYTVYCWRDLDNDGYKEPYIVWLRKDTGNIYRVKANYITESVEQKDGVVVRIKPEDYFTKFPFIPSPDGGFYDIGLGSLLGAMNESINTLFNQLIDAGTLSNTGGGFLGRGVRFRSGNNYFRPGEWKPTDSPGADLKNNILPLPVREPSGVLLELLKYLITYGERVAGSTEIMTGVSPGQNTPAETSRNALQQGEKVFNGIFKRTWRAMREEFQKMYRLNELYLTDEVINFEFNGSTEFINQKDFNLDSSLIRPAADPNVVSDSQKIAQAAALMQASAANPGYNRYEVNKRYLEANRIEDIELVLPDPKGPNAIAPPQNPKVQIEQMKVEERKASAMLKFKIAQGKLMTDAAVAQAKIIELQAKAILELEQADGVKAGHAIAMLEAQIGAQRSQVDATLKALGMLKDFQEESSDGGDKGAVPSLEGQPNNG